ncbi:MAG: radical SAM protein [Dehalococcoidales bacterium]|nr:radical SAM protein [Dehalococcoidales bacterium]
MPEFQRPEIIRPPSEWRSYYLPLTAGCSNNSCTFCSNYGSKLQVRDIEDVKKEIDALALYLKNGVTLPEIHWIVYAIAREWDGKGVFLQDGDALVYPFSKMKEVLTYLNQKLPHVERVATYATTQDILRRSPDELKELRKLKLGIFYIGLETGSDELLKKIGKGVDSRQEIEAARRAKEAGILTSVSVILGIGGKENSEKHALETARVLSEMDPDYVGALTLTLVPGTPLYKDWQDGEISLITPFESLVELSIIIKNSNFTHCFFSSMHASNYFSVRGTLPQDKERMIAELERIIQQGDPALLRPEFLRGL